MRRLPGAHRNTGAATARKTAGRRTLMQQLRLPNGTCPCGTRENEPLRQRGARPPAAVAAGCA
eukprot:986112-Lingulodinium_polyedra.AAC.1